MLLSQQSEFALTGERGLDVFRRIEDKDQRRHHYECVATIRPDGTIDAFCDYARNHPDRIRQAGDRLQASPLGHAALTLTKPASFPSLHAPADHLDLFQYLDFLRVWQVGQMALDRFEASLTNAPPPTTPEISAALRVVWNLNQLARAQTLIDHVMPFLDAAVRAGKDDKWQNAGYSLRMVGDLQLRLGAPDKALAAYEGSLSLGENPFRRALAIRAAHAAGNAQALRDHLAQYATRWDLPADLAALAPPDTAKGRA